MIALANKVDADLCGLFTEIWQHAGVAGTTPGTFKALGDAAQRLDEAACPPDMRRLVLNPAANWSMADALKGLFAQDIVQKAVKKGRLTQVAGMEIFMDQNIKRHTHTAFTTDVPVVDGTLSSDSSSIQIDGFVGTFAEGDVFSIAGVNDVNPVSGEDTGQLKQFTVTTAATSSDAAVGASVPFAPTLIVGTDTRGLAYKNVTAYPIDGATVTVVDSHAANLAFHRNALGLVTVPIEMPDSAQWKARESHRGLSVRLVKDWDFDTDNESIRCDILYGVKAIYPELACRLLG